MLDLTIDRGDAKKAALSRDEERERDRFSAWYRQTHPDWRLHDMASMAMFGCRALVFAALMVPAMVLAGLIFLESGLGTASIQSQFELLMHQGQAELQGIWSSSAVVSLAAYLLCFAGGWKAPSQQAVDNYMQVWRQARRQRERGDAR
ncbi:hypothetical protein RM531_08365 [Salinisphaera sp. P385]|uniref:Uncharacterized protein n=1 Tax=Spectribacter acetivorans TaxID=3075603 RepID=A0ABU3B7Q4_9GAMM|nr:hypothetical protein [Salinisphaera sp. P385]MDT0618489.1 hypothetical protein [Salinisphaera sp. P385]